MYKVTTAFYEFSNNTRAHRNYINAGTVYTVKISVNNVIL